MASTAGSVMLRASAHLNDVNQLVYDTETLLPFFQMALDELDEELAVWEIPLLNKESIIILVPSGSLLLPEMPVDYVESISIVERIQGSTDRWNYVREASDINPNLKVSPADGIIQWAFRSNQIYINPPISAREVLLNYVSGLVPVTDEGTGIDIEQSRRFLALTTARNAARDLGNSQTKASMFDADITRARDRLVRRLHKNAQHSMGVRRRPFTGRG